jgi:hypothetical protein
MVDRKSARRCSSSLRQSGELFALDALVTPTAQGIASRVLARTAAGNITLYAFDASEELSEHTAPFDALVLTLSGALVLLCPRSPQVDNAFRGAVHLRGNGRVRGPSRARPCAPAPVGRSARAPQGSTCLVVPWVHPLNENGPSDNPGAIQNRFSESRCRCNICGAQLHYSADRRCVRWYVHLFAVVANLSVASVANPPVTNCLRIRRNTEWVATVVDPPVPVVAQPIFACC